MWKVNLKPNANPVGFRFTFYKLWKLEKKVKRNWTQYLKCVTTTTKTTFTKVRVKPKAIGTSDLNASVTLPWRCRLSENFSDLFELHHMRRFHNHFQIKTGPIKCITTTAKSKVTMVRSEPKTICTADVDDSPWPWRQCRYCDKLSIYLNHLTASRPIAIAFIKISILLSLSNVA